MLHTNYYGCADYSKRQLKTYNVSPFDLNRIQVATLTFCNVQVKKHYCTMLATGNCAVTNVTYNENKYYVVTWTAYLESWM